MKTFYAKIDTINETSYDTNTMSVITETGERLTVRIDETIKLDVGEVYCFEAESITFKEREQYLIHKHTHLFEAPLTFNERAEKMRQFYPHAPVAMDAVKNAIETSLTSIDNTVVKAITNTIYHKYQNDFYLYPAATKFHHAYIGGLAYHTKTMLDLAEGFMRVYPFLNRDLLVAGIIIHDICKTTELSDYKAPEYTTEGRLIGHITEGVKTVAEAAKAHNHYDTEERLLLEHMVISHHYYGNFGSPKKPNTPEALALHFIDNIDSKFTVLGEALNTIKEGEFTPPIPVLDREKFYKAKTGNK